eukprot:1313694-Prorocentrum_lima.AAC.1
MIPVSLMSRTTSNYLLALFQNLIFHDVKNDFKLPPGPVPELGFHEVKNNFTLPTEGPEHDGGPEVADEEQEKK